MHSCPVCRNAEVEDFATVFDRVRRVAGQMWLIRRCRSCGFGWTCPMPSAEQLAAYYPPAYLGDTRKTLDEYLSGRLQRSRSWRGEAAKVRLIQRFVAGGRILDVGCGDAKFLWALDPVRWQRTGVDHSGETLELVRRRIPGLDLVDGDIFSGRLTEGAFDAVTFWHVLEHLPDPARVLGRVRALLKTGGWLFVSLPNLDSLQARLFGKHWYAFDDVPRHLYHFSRGSLERLLQDGGFEVRRHFPFSLYVNSHSLKHSLLNWSEDRLGNAAPYYALKPLLYGLGLLERLTGRYGILTVAARSAVP